jgi:hypothetical protein
MARMLFAVRIWILISVLLVSAGWILSALHQLNRVGYAAVFALAGIVFACWWRKNNFCAREIFRRSSHKFRRRFKRPAPFLFWILALLSLLSGFLYPALNYDANQYRLPRVFHWLWAEQWHWIHTYDSRMNISGCGFEWLSAPLMLFTRGDRFIFLINWVSYLLLPGLIFSVFTRLQVRTRVAWWWMWILPSGWCYVFQASSVANDSFAVIYALAALDLALRARENKNVADLWLSLLAVALLTGTKQTNIPLALPWLVAAWPSMRLLLARPAGTFFFVAVAALVSIVPVSVFNFENCGTWMPVDASIATLGQFQLNPFWGIVGNTFCIPLQNLVPPFYDLIPPLHNGWMDAWNEIMRQFRLTPLGAHFDSFERFGHLSGRFYGGIAEGNAGIGLAICLLALVSIRDAARHRKNGGVEKKTEDGKFQSVLRLAPWCALLVFMAKVGTYENARQLSAYYVLLFPVFLAKPGHSYLVRQRQWQYFSLGIIAFAGVMVVTSIARPLFPAKTILEPLHAKYPGSSFISHEYSQFVESNFKEVEAVRNYLATALPPTETVIGYYAGTCDVDEPGIWLPYGRRRAECISPYDSAKDLRALGIHYVVLNWRAVSEAHENLNQWMKRYDVTEVGQYQFSGEHTLIPMPEIYLFRLNEQH